jgi:hypothetical protein
LFEKEEAMPRIRKFLPLLSLLFVAAAPGPEKPKAEDIVDNYVKVTGGKEAYEKLHSIVLTGTMEIEGAGVKGAIKSYHTEPNKMYLEVDFPQIGKIEQGFDGKVAWEKSVLNGGRVLDGDERASFAREAAFNSDVNWRQYYSKAEVAGEESVEGKPAYKVVLTAKEGPPVTRYYDKESGFVVKQVETLNTAMGKITSETTFKDYKKLEGVLIPFSMRQSALNQIIKTAVSKAEANVEIPKNKFDLPADIKKLAEKK